MSAVAPALLIVDDNEDNRYTLTRRLQREGYQNLTAATEGQQALDLLQSRSFDPVLLDVMMPGLNGYQVLAMKPSRHCSSFVGRLGFPPVAEGWHEHA